MRSLKLEELRRRLLQPGSVDPAPSIIKSGRQVPSALPIFVQQLVDEDAREKKALTSEEHPTAWNISEVVPPSVPIVLAKDDEAAAAACTNPKAPAAATEKANGHPDLSSANQLAPAIDKLFEPARQCQQRLREITQSCEVVNQLAHSTLELCQPLRNFGDRLRRLSKAFFSIRTFRDELNTLAESFEPIGILNKQIVQLESAIQAQIAEVALTLESTKTLRARIAELEQSVDSVSELETQFLELSRCFGAPSSINHEGVEVAG
jgi:DNA repair exonuclease SbcCD ATPase subunit